MCGIAGVVAENPDVARAAVLRMLDAQTHRGPDDCGTELFTAGRLTLAMGARRLAVIDLSLAGHQPMIHPETGDCLVFSGEIYDYLSVQRELQANGAAFRGHSDTEILLHSLTTWGPSCLPRLNGMFALAFFDSRNKRLLLARDPLGIRPLYVAAVPGVFLFANEVRAILASELVPRRIDARGVTGMVAYGAVQEPNTIFDDIRAFPPGCWQDSTIEGLIAGPKPAIRRHWTYPVRRDRSVEAEAVETLRSTLEAAVRDHLVSDVPVGVFLSSGLDSTIVAALAARHTSRLHTFTVSFPDVPKMSEATLARETAKLLGTDHTDVPITGRDAQASVLAWLQSLDQPSVDGLNTFIVARSVRECGVGVALSGQGGDELLGGHSTFIHVPIAKALRMVVDPLPSLLRRTLALLVTAGRSDAVKLKVADMLSSDEGSLALYLQRRQLMSNQQLSALGFDPSQLVPAARRHLADTCQDLVLDEGDITRCVALLESRFYLGNTLLRDADANCMAHSLEVRVPMLDRRVLDCVLGLPGGILLPGRRADKHLLRRAFADLLRPALTAQTKHCFTLPIARWMMGPLREFCEDALADLKYGDIVQAGGVDAVWRAFMRAPASRMWSRAFTLCVLASYLRRMRATA